MRDYIAHWAIGIVAVILWGWGHALGVEPSLISYAAFILPSVVAAAGVQATLQRPQNKAPTVLPADPVTAAPSITAPAQEAQP